jgi:hypothetical protein
LGHDHHFLQRLDRVSAEQVELALGLYNDAELVKTVLTRAKLPDEAERVAISMDHPATGPFLIVSRSGRFVTCLGPGMRVSNLPVITRVELDSIATKLTGLREQIKRARAVAPTNSELSRLMQRIGRAGHALPREDFRSLELWAPLMWQRYLIAYVQLTEQVESQKVELVHYEGHKETDAVLQSFWNQVHGLGHMAMLAAAADHEDWEQIGKQYLQFKYTYSRSTTAQDIMSVALRGAFCAAIRGPVMIASYEQALHADELMDTGYDAIIGLLAIGCRHESLREPVKKMLREAKEIWAKKGGPLEWRAVMADVALPMLDGPVEYGEKAILAGREVIFNHREGLPKDSPYRFEAPEAVPQDLALSVFTNAPNEWRSEISPITMMSFVPYVARSKAEDLYVPRGLSKQLLPPWERSQTIELLERYGRRRHVETVRVDNKVGRNDPCPCGSGKKYKKCHGQ